MYTEFNGRVWSSEENYLKYKSNIAKNLDASLAIEDYADNTGEDSVYNDEAFILLKEYRKNNNEMKEEKLLEITSLIAKKFNELFDKIGRDKFIFYEDGNVNYIWIKK